MPEWIPRLDDIDLPMDVRRRLNALLSDHVLRVLSDREGLVVDVAEAVREAVNALRRSPDDDESPSIVIGKSGAIAASVVEWLREKTPDDVGDLELAIAGALRGHFDTYEKFEAGVLARVNVHIAAVMTALDLESGPLLTHDALSRLCGRTPRDWFSV